MKYSLLFISIFLVFALAGFVSAPEESSGGGGGGNSSNTLGLIITQPSNGTIFVNADVDISIDVMANSKVSCQFSGNVCDSLNTCKDITYRSCSFCDLTSAYYLSAGAYYDSVPGWNYNIQATCKNKTGSTELKKVSFNVQGDASADTIAPQIAVNSPNNGVNYVSSAAFNFEVNELAHCEYTIAKGNGAGHISLPGYRHNFKSYLTLETGNTYTITLDCTDLNGNSAEKVITFKAISGGSSGGGGGDANNTSGGGQGGGCYDSDGGQDYYKKGIAAGIYDSCVSKYKVSERYCTDNNQGADYIKECPLGYLCNDGACVQSDEDDRTAQSGGGGGSGSSLRCEKFYNCSDGSQVKYCFIHNFYNENGEVTGEGCGCKSNPQSLCIAPPSSGGGEGSGGQPILINSSSGGGGGRGSIGTNETPIICNGCILGNKCAPVGYRQEGKYCTLNSEFISQLNAETSCENNFECSTNLCIDNKCVSSGLWQKFIRWISRLFG